MPYVFGGKISTVSAMLLP